MVFDVSWQYVDQDRLRTGTSEANSAAVLVEGGEVRTVSRIAIGKAQLDLGERWRVSASLPYVDRRHQHVTTGLLGPELREWNYTGFGDLTLLGSWTALRLRAATETPLTLALQGGLKLPTGRRHVARIDGEEPEPHARPGTGSTDLLAGLQAVQLVPLPTLRAGGEPTALFASALYMHTTRGTDRHRVGRMLEAHAGIAHPIASRLRLTAQVNLRSRGKDHTEAEAVEETAGDHDHATRGRAEIEHEGESHGSGTHEDTGGTSVFLSPGLRYELSPRVALSGYAQVPVYRRVNGTQLVAPSQFWLGLTYRLR
jgi:hypothetical protein